MMTDEFNRVKLDRGVTNKMHQIQRNTGLTPNYLARIGLCYSLGEDQPPSLSEYDTDGKAINRHTLLGEHDELYIALVRKRMLNEGRNPDEEFYEYFLAHMNRGLETLSGRVGDLTDFYELVPEGLKTPST
jgi:DNA sulfur modification protein DndE